MEIQDLSGMCEWLCNTTIERCNMDCYVKGVKNDN